MKRLKSGDIFEIETKKGKGYFQLIDTHKLKGDLIRVYYGLYDNLPGDIERITKSDFYYIGFPLKFALSKKLVSFVGHVPLESNFKRPKYFREKSMVRGEFKGWLIVNSETEEMKLVEKLTEEQKKFSPSGIANDNYIIDRYEEGWRLDKWE